MYHKISNIVNRVICSAYNVEIIEEVRNNLYDYADALEEGRRTKVDVLSDLTDDMRHWFPEHFKGHITPTQALRILSKNKTNNPAMIYIQEFIEKVVEDKLERDPLDTFESKYLPALYFLLNDEELSPNRAESTVREELVDCLGFLNCKNFSNVFEPYKTALRTNGDPLHVNWGRILALSTLNSSPPDCPEALDLRLLIQDWGLEDITSYGLAEFKARDFAYHVKPWGFTWSWASEASRIDARITPANIADNYFAKIEHPSGLTIWLSPSCGIKYLMDDYIKKPHKAVSSVLGEMVERLTSDQYISLHDQVYAAIKSNNYSELKEMLWIDDATFEEYVLEWGEPTLEDVKHSNTFWGELIEKNIISQIEDDEYLVEFAQEELLEDSINYYATEVFEAAIIGGDEDAVVFYENTGYDFERLRTYWEDLEIFIKLNNSSPIIYVHNL